MKWIELQEIDKLSTLNEFKLICTSSRKIGGKGQG